MNTARPIVTASRKIQLSKIGDVLARQGEKLQAIIEDLSKTNIDDKKSAQALLKTAKKFDKSIKNALQ